MRSSAVRPAQARTWAQHWSRGPRAVAERFNRLRAPDLVPLLASLGLAVREQPQSLGSVENRVFRCDVAPGGVVVLKLYRPGRWSLEALREEMDFIRDVATGGVAVVRPRVLPSGGEIGCWQGIFFALFEAEENLARPAGPCGEAELRALGRLVARLHIAARRRPALHRMTIDAARMGLSNLRYVERGGLIPPDLMPEYNALARTITKLAVPLLSGVPVHRLHGDFGVHNLLWTARGTIVADFDDFMVGPAAFDLCRVYVGLRTPWGEPDVDEAARDRVTREVVEGYRTLVPLPEAHIRPMEALRALRMIWNDAWKRARLHDASFREARSAMRDRDFWLPRMAFLRRQAEKLRAL